MSAADRRLATAGLADELAWFERALKRRIAIHVGETAHVRLVEAEPAPTLREHGCAYGGAVRRWGLDAEARLALALALAPHVRPQALDPLCLHNIALQRRFTEFGGLVEADSNAFTPTRQTALFVLAGEDLGHRLAVCRLFEPDHPLQRAQLFERPETERPSSLLSTPLRLRPGAISALTGMAASPVLDSLAEPLVTAYGWDDLVLDPTARRDVEDILTWQRSRRLLLEDWGLARSLKPGFRALFHGPSGTGKTLTAALIGKAVGQPVYRVDASQVVSKYIGETEKALSRLFEQAEGQDVVLFFDEADSLFGSRVEAKSANDRFANQEVAYLLQRIEAYDGLVILASNLKGAIDDAFARRFQATIRFAPPDADQRLRLWRGHFRDGRAPLSADVEIEAVARDYALSGGAILNVLRYACLRAARREPMEVRQADLVAGAARELHKAGRLVP